jgi:hypothetical protein
MLGSVKRGLAGRQQAAGQKSLRVRKGGGDDPHAPDAAICIQRRGAGGGENEMGQEMSEGSAGKHSEGVNR